MVESELNQYSLYELHKKMEVGQCSAVEIATACIRRIEERESTVHAFEDFDPQLAVEAADRIDQGRSSGLIRGIPLGIKDVIDVKDQITTWGSPIYQHRVPQWDASCVALCREAGANIFGKTVSTEFACFYPGKTTNPHNARHTPGGSSMGSAAAVADYMLPFAFGTQTAASVTRPAAYCGIVGYKATWGSFDLQGICGLASSLDTLGFLCRDLRDIPLMRSVLCGDNPVLEHRKQNSPPKIGFVRTPYWNEADNDTQDLLENTTSQLGVSGATVAEVKLTSEFAELAYHHSQVMAFEVARSRFNEYLHHKELLSAQFIALIESGREISFDLYQQSKQCAIVARSSLQRIFMDYDVLLAPSAPGEAPNGLEATGNPLFSRMWTLLHVPSITIPYGTGANGLPLGIQLIGSFDQDSRLVSDVDWIRRALTN